MKTFNILAPMQQMDGYIFIGVGVALSVLGFFLKRIKTEMDQIKVVMQSLEVSMAKHDERIKTLLKLVEDRRRDVQTLFQIHNKSCQQRRNEK